MAFLKKISLIQFRNYEWASFDFHHRVIGINGANGIGKTNLLDAIYYLIFTKSYFQSKEINNVMHGKEGFRIEGHYDNNDIEELVLVWNNGKKSLTQNKIDVEKLTLHIGKLSGVMIAPDDIELINGASEIRRKFVDGILSQADANYLNQLITYQKILAQRNAYLKTTPYSSISNDVLDVYDEQLAKSGAVLISKRIQFSNYIPAIVAQFYSNLSESKEEVHISYKNCALSNDLMALLKNNRRKDIESRRTSTGPHTEDWLFTMNEYPVKTQASQGQKKSLLLSLKLMQMMYLKQQGKNPILLLDDIFEKLDKKRIQQLFILLKDLDIPQIFVTHTDAEEWKAFAEKHFGEIQSIQLQ